MMCTCDLPRVFQKNHLLAKLLDTSQLVVHIRPLCGKYEQPSGSSKPSEGVVSVPFLAEVTRQKGEKRIPVGEQKEPSVKRLRQKEVHLYEWPLGRHRLSH